nr:MAG TPA: hypothetical protein [Caudoviricetes sp.]
MTLSASTHAKRPTVTPSALATNAPSPANQVEYGLSLAKSPSTPMGKSWFIRV